MTEIVVQNWTYQAVMHPRNRRLHELIDIAGEAWNYCIAYERWAYRWFGVYVHNFDLQRHVAALRRDIAAYEHWQLLNSQAFKYICDRVHKAYKAFFKKVDAGKAESYKKQSAWSLRKYGRLRKGQPRFRKVKDHRSFTLPIGNGCQLVDSDNPKIGKLRLTLGWRGAEEMTVRFYIGGRPLPDRVKAVTIMRTGDGKFWLSFVVERELSQRDYVSTVKVGGFDFGLWHFLTTDEGETIDSPQYLFQELDELRRRSKKLSGRGRKTVGSVSWKREQKAVARLHARIANRRSDFHWKLAHDLCERYDILVFETLDIEKLKRQQKYRMDRRKISDLALSAFLRKLESVAEKTGRQIIYADRWYPSTKTCSVCGHVAADMPPSRRIYECVACGLIMDRDHNAARNLKQLGRGSVPDQSGVSDCPRFADSGAPVLTARPIA